MSPIIARGRSPFPDALPVKTIREMRSAARSATVRTTSLMRSSFLSSSDLARYVRAAGPFHPPALRMAEIGLKLGQNAFQAIPDI